MSENSGLLMKKLGCSAIYDSNYKRIPVTLLYLDDSYIVSFKEQVRDGYNALVVGYGEFKSVKRPQLAMLERINVASRCKFYESFVSDIGKFKIGGKLSIHFVLNQYVDVTGRSIGKGFAGVMKRHNFSGMRASHGVSIAHRSQGSTGQCQDPGRVFKGKKMAGHLGDKRITAQNLKIVYIDLEKSLIAVKGNNVPGFSGSYVFVKSSVKKNAPREASDLVAS